MKNNNRFFNMLSTGIVLVVFIVLIVLPSTSFAVGGCDEKQCTSVGGVCKGNYCWLPPDECKMPTIPEEDTSKCIIIHKAFNNEIDAYTNLGSALSNAMDVMKKEGVAEGEIFKLRRSFNTGLGLPGGAAVARAQGKIMDKYPPTLVKIVIDEERRTCLCFTMRQLGGTVSPQQVSFVITIDEERRTKVLDALRALARASEEYNNARLNTVSRIKEAGVVDESKILEVLKALYEPFIVGNTLADAVNQAMVDFPFLARIFGNERMNVFVDRLEPFSIVTKNGKVESISTGEIRDPTLKVYSDTGAVDQLIAGELTPLEALEQGKIRYEGVGFMNKVKVGVLDLASKILRKVIRFKAGSELASKIK
jgi:hypothetical protein